MLSPLELSSLALVLNMEMAFFHFTQICTTHNRRAHFTHNFPHDLSFHEIFECEFTLWGILKHIFYAFFGL